MRTDAFQKDGAYFVFRWGIVEGEWDGPYEEEETAIRNLEEVGVEDSQLEYGIVVGPLPVCYFNKIKGTA